MQFIKEQEWQALPEPAQQEVYDFFLFIKQRYTKPIEQTKKSRKFGQHRGLIDSSEDFDEPLPDSFWLGDEQ